MKRSLSSVLALVAVVAVGAPAFAQSSPTSKPAAHERVRNVAIDADELVGELVVPNMDVSLGRGTVEHGSLIRVRSEFVREIAKAAEDL